VLWPALTAVAVLAIPIFNAAIEADSVEAGRPVHQSDWMLPFRLGCSRRRGFAVRR
jgi:hypothetical protein